VALNLLVSSRRRRLQRRRRPSADGPAHLRPAPSGPRLLKSEAPGDRDCGAGPVRRRSER